MSIYGLVIIMVINMVMIFGINDSVILLIWVVVCKILMIRFVISVISNSGVVSVSVIFIVLVFIIMIDLGVILFF